MRRSLIALVALPVAGALAFAAVRLASAGDPASTVVRLGNATCPVTGEAVDPKLVRDWQGVEVAFCCADCPDKFVADPAKYAPALLKDLAGQLAVAKAKLAKLEPAAAPAAPSKSAKVTLPLDLSNAKCPVMGGDTKPALFAEYHGMKVHFCCGMCNAKFLADPTSYLGQMKAASPAMAQKIEAAEAAWAAAHPDGR